MSLLYSNSINYQDPDFRKNRQQQLQIPNSGPIRYRSAPTSFFDTLFTQNDGAGITEPDDFRFFRPSSPETDAIMASFMSPSDISSGGNSNSLNIEQYREERSEIKQEMEDSGQMAHQSVPVNYEMNNYGNSEKSFALQPLTKMNSSNGSNLLRQNSSPPEFFSNQGLHYGLNCITKDGFNEEASLSNRRFKNQINLRQIDELGNENSASTSPESNINTKRKYMNVDSWLDSSCHQFKRLRNNDEISFSTLNVLETQNGNCGTGLIHHHSLPKTASELATMEKLLKFQGSPCKIRAKRGFATHPRSIAERLRRTRISERMRKLQDLFPSIDKQTNTSDMLDMAVEYIKDLQKEVKNLADCKSKCRCSISHNLSNSSSF